MRRAALMRNHVVMRNRRLTSVGVVRTLMSAKVLRRAYCVVPSLMPSSGFADTTSMRTALM